VIVRDGSRPRRYRRHALTLVLIIIGVLGVVALAGLLIYNGMVSRRNAVDNSWAQIEAALQRRHDLIPNLVETVKGYARHERRTFEEVTAARSGAVTAGAPPTRAAAEDALTAAIGRLMVVAEQYPELRATENFQQLQAQLSETEDQIAITRRVYNDTVQTYNTLIQQFPAVLVANAFRFEPRLFFDAPREAEATPEVGFSQDGTRAPAKIPKS
jgi:LemA protein